MPQQFDHERFEELCALATAGVLTAAETEELFAHLDSCAECSQHFSEYQSLATEAMPLLVDLHRSAPEVVKFDEKSAFNRLLRAVDETGEASRKPSVPFLKRLPRFAWQSLIAASILLGVGLGSFKLGQLRHSEPIARRSAPAPESTSAASESQELKNRLQNANHHEADLEEQVAQREAELSQLRANTKQVQTQLSSLVESLTASKSESTAQMKALTEQRDALTLQIQEAEQRYSGVQEDLNRLRLQRNQDLAKISSLENQVTGLNVAMNEQSNRSRDDEQYLASDRDIRELIGARNLYIADIMDVREDGSSRKPFGRVFYTKTKSLIFYAYDLDKQPGIKQASTFHVWGRTGPNDRKPLNLGVLYLDSETSRRWTLRVDNPEQLARLDAVFVTVEPHVQTDTPTGKPFLYASLRREPNHP